MLFDLTHCLYILISLALTIGILIGCHCIKEQPWKDFVLKVSGFATFALHVSWVYVHYFETREINVPDNVIFPLFFCNLMMYLLLLVAYWPNKQSKFFKYMAILVAYGGFFGAMISLFYPDYYVSNPTLADWGVLKSMLSHSTMLVGSLWLFVGGYVKVRVSNFIPLLGGMAAVLLLGLTNTYGLKLYDGMYLTHSAIDDVPLFTGYFIGGCILALSLLFMIVYEQMAYPKEERWYSLLSAKAHRGQ
jgi:hypothetical protein